MAQYGYQDGRLMVDGIYGHRKSRECTGPSRYCLVLCRSICTRNPPYEQWLVGMGAGAVPFVIIVEAWLLAPGPPCEQVLTVVGDRCWGAVSLCTLMVDTHPTSRCS
jgi:hypothetical protein